MAIERTVVQKSREVSALLTIPNSRIIAGGTFPAPDNADGSYLIDISSLEGLDEIKQKGNRIEIGALTKLQTIADSSLIKKYVPALAEASALTGTAEIRSRGTLGGNLAASLPGDLGTALLAAGAKLTITTASDFREILIDRFRNQDGSCDLQYDEWVTRITVRTPADPFWGMAFGKIGTWGLNTGANAAAAILMSLDAGDKVVSVRGGLRLGSSTIRRMFPLEKALKNQKLTEETAAKAVQVMIPSVKNEIEEKEFSVFLAEILRRCGLMAAERRAH